MNPRGKDGKIMECYQQKPDGTVCKSQTHLAAHCPFRPGGKGRGKGNGNTITGPPIGINYVTDYEDLYVIDAVEQPRPPEEQVNPDETRPTTPPVPRDEDEDRPPTPISVSSDEDMRGYGDDDSRDSNEVPDSDLDMEHRVTDFLNQAALRPSQAYTQDVLRRESQEREAQEAQVDSAPQTCAVCGTLGPRWYCPGCHKLVHVEDCALVCEFRCKTLLCIYCEIEHEEFGCPPWMCRWLYVCTSWMCPCLYVCPCMHVCIFVLESGCRPSSDMPEITRPTCLANALSLASHPTR